MDSKTYIKDLIHFPLHSAIFGQRQKESFTISQGHSSLGVSCHFITNKLATLPLNKQTHSKPTSLFTCRWAFDVALIPLDGKFFFQNLLDSLMGLAV